jgi:hypothetical protein
MFSRQLQASVALCGPNEPYLLLEYVAGRTRDGLNVLKREKYVGCAGTRTSVLRLSCPFVN